MTLAIGAIAMALTFAAGGLSLLFVALAAEKMGAGE